MSLDLLGAELEEFLLHVGWVSESPSDESACNKAFAAELESTPDEFDSEDAQKINIIGLGASASPAVAPARRRKCVKLPFCF